MEESGFVKYETVKEVLDNASFFGFTAHREDDDRRIVRTFKSVKWFKTFVEVTTLKLEPKKFNSKQIVLNIKVNEIEINGLEDFKNRIGQLGKSYGSKKKQDIHH